MVSLTASTPGREKDSCLRGRDTISPNLIRLRNRYSTLTRGPRDFEGSTPYDTWDHPPKPSPRFASTGRAPQPQPNLAPSDLARLSGPRGCRSPAAHVQKRWQAHASPCGLQGHSESSGDETANGTRSGSMIDVPCDSVRRGVVWWGGAGRNLIAVLRKRARRAEGCLLARR